MPVPAGGTGLNATIVSSTGGCDTVSSGFNPGMWFNEHAVGITDFSSVSNLEGPEWNLAQPGSMAGFNVLFCTNSQESATEFNYLKQNLETLGFTVDEDCNLSGNLDAASYNVAVIVNSAPGPFLTVGDAEAVSTFLQAGRGVYLLADNCPYFNDVNQILANLPSPLDGITLQGNDLLSPSPMNYGNPLVPGEFGDHPVFTGVAHMSSGDTLSAPFFNGVADGVGSFGVLATVACSTLVYCTGGKISMASHPSLLYLDPAVQFQHSAEQSSWGRIMLDMAFTRFYHEDFGAGRYGANAVVWLSDPNRFYRELRVFQELPAASKNGISLAGCFSGDNFVLRYNVSWLAGEGTEAPTITFSGNHSSHDHGWAPSCLLQKATVCPSTNGGSPTTGDERCVQCYVDIDGGTVGHYQIFLGGVNTSLGFIVQPSSLIARATLVSESGKCTANAAGTVVSNCAAGDVVVISWTLPNPSSVVFAGSNNRVQCASLNVDGTDVSCTLGTVLTAPNGAYPIEIDGIPTGISLAVDGGCRLINVSNTFEYCRHGDKLLLPFSGTFEPTLGFSARDTTATSPGCLTSWIRGGSASATGRAEGDPMSGQLFIACYLDLTGVTLSTDGGSMLYTVELNGKGTGLTLHLSQATIQPSASVSPLSTRSVCGAATDGVTVTGCGRQGVLRLEGVSAAGAAVVSLYPAAASATVVGLAGNTLLVDVSNLDAPRSPVASGNYALLINGVSTGLALPHASGQPTIQWTVVPGLAQQPSQCSCAPTTVGSHDEQQACSRQVVCTAPVLCTWLLFAASASVASELTLAPVSPSTSGGPAATMHCRPSSSSASTRSRWCYLTGNATGVKDVSFAVLDGGTYTGITVRLDGSSNWASDGCPAPPPSAPDRTTSSSAARVAVGWAINGSLARTSELLRALQQASGPQGTNATALYPYQNGLPWWTQSSGIESLCWWKGESDVQYHCVWDGSGGRTWWGGWPAGVPATSWWWPGLGGDSTISGSWLYLTTGTGGWTGAAGGFTPSSGSAPAGTFTGTSGGTGPTASASGSVVVRPSGNPGTATLDPVFWSSVAAAAGSWSSSSCAVLFFVTPTAAAWSCPLVAVWEETFGACGELPALLRNVSSSPTAAQSDANPLNPPRVLPHNLSAAASASPLLGAAIAQLTACSANASDVLDVPLSGYPGAFGSMASVVVSDDQLPEVRVVTVRGDVVPSTPPITTAVPSGASVENMSCVLSALGRGAAIECRVCVADGVNDPTTCTPYATSVPSSTLGGVCDQLALPVSSSAPSASASPSPPPRSSTPASSQAGPASHHGVASWEAPSGALVCTLPSAPCYRLRSASLASLVGTAATAGVALVGIAALYQPGRAALRHERGRRLLRGFAFLMVVVQDGGAVGVLRPRFLPNSGPGMLADALAWVVGQDVSRLAECLEQQGPKPDHGPNGTLVIMGVGVLLTVILVGSFSLAAWRWSRRRLREPASVPDWHLYGTSGSEGKGLEREDIASSMLGTVVDGNSSADPPLQQQPSPTAVESSPSIQAPREHDKLLVSSEPSLDRMIGGASPGLGLDSCAAFGAAHVVGLAMVGFLQCTPGVAFLARAAVWGVVTAVCLRQQMRRRGEKDGQPVRLGAQQWLVAALGVGLAGASVLLALAAIRDTASLAAIAFFVYAVVASLGFVGNLRSSDDTHVPQLMLLYVVAATVPSFATAAILLPGMNHTSGATVFLIVLVGCGEAALLVLAGIAHGASRPRRPIDIVEPRPSSATAPTDM